MDEITPDAPRLPGDILVVDDNVANLKTIDRILTEAGHHVRCVANGRTALMVVSSKMPELILMDVRMPGMNGYELCHEIKQLPNGKGIPVLFLSAADELDDMVRGFRSGGVDYVTKPFSPEEILARVETHLNLRRLQLAMADAYGQVERQVEERTRELQKTVDALRESERALLVSKRKTESANRAKTEFLANMNHEMRTPLNAVIGFTEIVLLSTLTEQQREYLNIVLERGKDLLELIQNILDITRIEADRIELIDQPFEIADVMQRAFESVHLAALQKGVALEIMLPPDLPGTVRGDCVRLRQVLINLVNNAVKFTPKGHVLLKASHAPSATPNVRTITFHVCDTGIGISPEKQKIIFEPFQQGDNSLCREHGGAGLGLSICRHLVERMGSKLELESEVDKGSDFHFTVDFQLDSDQELIPPMAQPAPHASGMLERSLRVLLAEDDDFSRELVIQLLEPHGYTAVGAPDGAEAVKLLREEDFDVALIDLQMPKMNGLTLAKTVRSWKSEMDAHVRRRARIHMIALTAHAMTDAMESCMEAGMDDFMTKPLNAKLLREKLHARSIIGKAEDE